MQTRAISWVSQALEAKLHQVTKHILFPANEAQLKTKGDRNIASFPNVQWATNNMQANES